MTKENPLDFDGRSGDKFAKVNISVVRNTPEGNGITKASEIAVFCAIASFADNSTRDAFPSVKSIAERARVGERTARSAIKVLKESGYIEVDPKFVPDNCADGKFRQTSNVYNILDR